MKYNKLSHCILSLLLGAALICSCNKSPMLAMAEEADATDMQSNIVGNDRRVGNFWPCEGAYYCSKGKEDTLCRELERRDSFDSFVDLFLEATPVDGFYKKRELSESSTTEIQKLKTELKTAQSMLDQCKNDLEFKKTQLTNVTTNSAAESTRCQHDLEKCQEDLGVERNRSLNISHELNITQGELNQAKMNLTFSENLSFCNNQSAPSAGTANTETGWPQVGYDFYCGAAGGVTLVGVVGAWMWKKMSIAVRDTTEQLRVTERKASAKASNESALQFLTQRNQGNRSARSRNSSVATTNLRTDAISQSEGEG